MMSKLKSTKKMVFNGLGLLLALLIFFAYAADSTSAVAASASGTLPQTQAIVDLAVPAQQSDCSGVPQISYFSASPTTIEPGQTATLTWGPVNNAQVAYLVTPGQKTGVGTPGQMTVQPDQTTTYMIQAVCGETTAQALVTVNVGVSACGNGGSPVISSFTANPLVIEPGQTTTLSWGLVENAQAAVLVTPEGKQGVATPGELVVQPGQTTTYQLFGYCGNDVVGQSVTVTVAGTLNCTGVPNIPFFIANPQVIQSGQSSTLQWGPVTNASGVYLSTPGGIVGVATPGQETVQPSQSTNYALFAQCGSNTIQANTTIYVQ